MSDDHEPTSGSEQEQHLLDRRQKLVTCIAVGVGLGCGLGVVFDSLAIGVAIGAGVGVALGSSGPARRDQDPNER